MIVIKIEVLEDYSDEYIKIMILNYLKSKGIKAKALEIGNNIETNQYNIEF